jgi:hypothetical protein
VPAGGAVDAFSVCALTTLAAPASHSTTSTADERVRRVDRALEARALSAGLRASASR